jgi:hypothetical protein
VTKKYQTNAADTSALAVPGQVSVAMDEIAADMRDGLLALAVGAGLQVMQQLMEADVTAACGPRGKQIPGRVATRHGTERGSVTLGGRRVPVARPRVRAADGSGEVPVPAYELFNGTELLGKMAMERMLGGLSTRRYPVGLEPVGEAVEESSRSTSKSAVSRKFVAMTETALADLLAKDLSELDLGRVDDRRGVLRRAPVRRRARHRHRRNQAPAGIGGRVDGEHHGGEGAADRAARPGPGHHQADPRGARRRQGPDRRGQGGVRPAGDRSLSAAQAEERA